MKLFLTLFLMAATMWAQVPSPTLSAQTGTVTFDKATDTVKYLPELTITSTNTAAFFYTTNIAAEYASTVFVTPAVNFLFPNSTGRIQISVAAANLPVGTYSIPVTFNQAAPQIAVTFALQLVVTDSRTYVLPGVNERMVPHVAAGQGWTTQLRLVNTGNSASISELRFYTANGEPTMFSANGFTTDYLPAVNVPARGYLDVMLGSGQPLDLLRTGTVRIKTLTGSVPGVNVIYLNPKFQSAVELKSANNAGFTIGFDNRNRNSTGVAIGNALNHSQTVTLEWFDYLGLPLMPNGAALATVTIPANGQVIFTMDQAYAFTRGLTGTMRVTAQQPAIVGFGLKFDLDQGVFFTEPAFVN
jgi:hypothetical protein